ncbi:hypothetical protein Clacol_006994 [Clathrus columnatus]|uniref:Uncharacterized protein n=1 Tax=Clathrus columnatus TaxID=1419009 RepID=A0AAV5ADQ3_9AGAM|nr:hypothetical protein Clacol_006994 [Clathrus columnatus]
MSFPENPAQYIQSTFGRLHESIIAEMRESNDLVNNENEDPDLGGEPDLGATADHIMADMNVKDCDEAQHIEVSEKSA